MRQCQFCLRRQLLDCTLEDVTTHRGPMEQEFLEEFSRCLTDMNSSLVDFNEKDPLLCTEELTSFQKLVTVKFEVFCSLAEVSSRQRSSPSPFVLFDYFSKIDFCTFVWPWPFPCRPWESRTLPSCLADSPASDDTADKRRIADSYYLPQAVQAEHQHHNGARNATAFPNTLNSTAVVLQPGAARYCRYHVEPEPAFLACCCLPLSAAAAYRCLPPLLLLTT
jgi:hypothetical protein